MLNNEARARSIRSAIRSFTESKSAPKVLSEEIARAVAEIVQGTCAVELATDDGHLRAANRRDDVGLVITLRARGDGIGTIAVTRTLEGAPPLGPEDLDWLQELAASASLALAHARGIELRERMAERLRILSETARIFSGALHDPDRLVELVAQRLAALVEDYSLVFLASEDGSELRLVALAAPDEAALDYARAVFAEPMLLDEHEISRAVHETGTPFFAPRLDMDAVRRRHASAEYMAFAEKVGLHSVMNVPLRIDGRSLGQVILGRYRAESPAFDEDDLRFATGLADQAALAIINARSFAAERGAQDRYRTMFEATPQPMFVVDMTTLCIEEMNDAALCLYGYVRAELPTLLLPDLWPAEEVEKYRLEIARTMPSRRGLHWRHRKKDGTTFDVEVCANVISSEGRMRRVVFVTDVSDRLRTDEARRAAETRYARLRDSGILGILVATLDGRILEANDTVADIVGYPREEILSERFRWPELTPAEWKPVDQRAYEQLMSTGVASPREKQFIHKDGSRVPVIIGTAMIDVEKRVCIALVLDLRESKRTAAAIEQLREVRASEATFRALVEERSRLAVLVESSDDAIIGKTLQGIITSWNDGAHRLFGYAASEAIGKSISMLVPSTHDAEEVAILDGLANGHIQHLDTERRRKDGRIIQVSVTCSPIRDEAGHISGACKVVRDMTARHEADTQLAHAKDEAESASRELEAFSYSVAHDLRAPLRGMNGFARVLLDTYGDKLDADGKDWLEEILLNARKMGELIDALLSLAKVTRSELRHAPVDLSALARETMRSLAAAEPARAHELQVADNLTAEVDPALACALLDNLLGNAWKFTSKVSVAKIEVGVTVVDGKRAFFVRDNGAGFDMAYAGKLFGPFQRLHTHDEFPGTGIGLATVQRIVRRHGGRVWAEGVVNGGATFYFSFRE